MAHSYTPGLKVSEYSLVRKFRQLPIEGDVLVEEGSDVASSDIVARAALPGDVATINMVNHLGVQTSDVPRFMVKNEGDTVSAGEVIAETRPFIKWFRTVVKSPIDGSIETISKITGQLILRTPPKPVEVSAYIDGKVVEVHPGQGVVVEAHGAFVQGILGVGGEVNGEIVIACDTPDAILSPDNITSDFAGKIVVAGSLVKRDVFDAAAKAGVAALVCGGFHDSDLRDLLGYDLGVAITGHENISPILIITEGFGDIAMADATFRLLKAHAGKIASANGATQIRAGVLRPEIIIPSIAASSGSDGKAGAGGLTIGSPVRIIRAPGFGRIGKVHELPPEAERVESEAKVRVARIEFPDGSVVTVPRSNVEAIET